MTTTQQKTVQRSAAKHAPAPGGGLSSVPIGRSMGNGALSDYLFSHYKVSDPADPAEVAAERTADRVMAGGQAQAEAPAGGGAEISRSPAPDAPARQGGGGGPMGLPDGVRERMEGAFGRSFGGVRMHHDARADALSRGFHADAFTQGHDIYFGYGTYNPGSRAGQHLIAHELSHMDADSRCIMRFPDPPETNPAPPPGTKPKGQTQGRKRKDSVRRKPKETDEETHVPIEFSGPFPGDPDYVETDWRPPREVDTDTQDPPPAPETPAPELAAPPPPAANDPEVERQKAVVDDARAEPEFERFVNTVKDDPGLLLRAADAKPEAVETEETAAKNAAKGTTGIGGAIQKAATKSDSDSTFTNLLDVAGAGLTEIGTDYTTTTTKLPGVSDEALGNHKAGGKGALAAGQGLTAIADALKISENSKKMKAADELTDAETTNRTRDINRIQRASEEASAAATGKPFKAEADAVKGTCDNLKVGNLAQAGKAHKATQDFIKKHGKSDDANESVKAMRMAEKTLARLSAWHGQKAQKKEGFRLAKNQAWGNAFSHGISAIGAGIEAAGSRTVFSKSTQGWLTGAGRVLSAVGGVVSSVMGAMGTVNKAKLAAQKKQRAREVEKFAKRTLTEAHKKLGGLAGEGAFDGAEFGALAPTAINKPAIEKWVPAAEAFTDLTDSDVDMGRFLQGCEDGDPDEIKAAAMTGLGFEG